MVADHQGVENQGGINPTVPIGPPILVDLSEGAMKLSRRKFMHLAAGAAALPAVSRVARAQKLSVTDGALGRRVSCWRRD
jgi:hypothetical protein